MTVPGLAMALDTRLVDDGIDDVVVIGHSLGGMIAQELALLEPERVRGLVLCNTIPGVTDGAREFNPVLATLAETEGSDIVAEALLPAMFGPKPLENTEPRASGSSPTCVRPIRRRSPLRSAPSSPSTRVTDCRRSTCPRW